MIGVVVWSNRVREQAVIWCDDHAALAYLVGRIDYPAEYGWPEPGDMLELHTEVEGELRCARCVKPLGDSVVSPLPQMLTGRASHLSVIQSNDTAPPTAEIIVLPQRVLAAS
ncbi:hypothetical protein DRW48_01880 [Paracoccus suum]|uniref:Uncharacterized protein n=1 Tax=Paracoccus suum TaxID=2259340 RepID=A0A344PGV4_9RHOB|nr:hypothetical protein [Paracoccus suum]AXC48609.1 hypothetical protein DRW48_01880 [Paracoccus suum]